MSRLGSYVLCAALCSLVVLGQGDITTEKPVTLVIPKDPSSTPPTEVPIERKKTTTTEPTTTSTTTTEPTTTSTTTTSTTTTTTPTPPAPTPKPTPPGPLPPPEQGTWSYMENNITCIVVQFAAQLNVTYTKAVEKSASLANVVLNIPANATVSNGDCNGTNQWLQLSWPAGAEVNNLTLVFHRNDTTKNYALQYLNISLANSLFPNASTPTAIELTHGAEWMTPLATSYRCTPASRLNMTADSANVVAALTLSRLQEEAFRTSPGKGFSAARECGGGDIPDTVPIVVGCALGGLVVVVLVAYLAARHRSRGYVSM